MTQKRNVPDAISVIHSRKSVRSFTGEAGSLRTPPARCGRQGWQ